MQTETAIADGVLRLIRDLVVGCPAQGVRLEDLCRTWRRAGLRRSDLHDALQVLVEQGSVSEGRVGGETHVSLRAPGELRLAALGDTPALVCLHMLSVGPGRRLGSKFQGVGTHRRSGDAPETTRELEL